MYLTSQQNFHQALQLILCHSLFIQFVKLQTTQLFLTIINKQGNSLFWFGRQSIYIINTEPKQQHSSQSRRNQTHQMNDLLFNSDGQCYVNTNLKLMSFQLIIKRRLIEFSQSLEHQLNLCQSNSCLKKVQKKLHLFQKTKNQLHEHFSQVKNKLQYEYLLCNDMIYENDIRICRKQTKQKSLNELKYLINQINLPQIKKTIAHPNN